MTFMRIHANRGRPLRRYVVGRLSTAPVRSTAGAWLRIAATAAIFASATTVWGQQRAAPGPLKTPNGVTWGELSLLPEYCADAQGILYGDQYSNTSPRATKWVAMMGDSFWAIHHYCYALANVRRADAGGMSPQMRNHLYFKATQDYLYTINNSAADMVLVPEILVRLGEAHLKLNDLGQAYDAFERARQKKPDYWPAYSRWVDVLIRINKRKEAHDLAEVGLRHAPQSEVLRKQFESVGGDPTKVIRVEASRPKAQSTDAGTRAPEGPAPAGAPAPASGTQ